MMCLRFVFLLLAVGCGSSSTDSSGGDGGALAGESGVDPGALTPVSGVFNGMRVDFSDALSGFYSVSKDQTLITAHLPGTKVGEGTGLKLFVRGKMAGSFSCGDEPDGGLSIGMGYSWTQGLTYNADYATTNSASATPCSIVIASYGAVGARLSGTFSGGLIAIGRTGPSATDPPQHMRVANGTFDLVRGADIP